MDFSSFSKDTVDFINKKTGEKIENLKASVQTNKLFLDRSDILVEPGDLFVRRMSNGGEETYEVIDPGFHEAWASFKAHYQMKVRKLGIPEANHTRQNNIYNITGHNTHINQNSMDNSINTINVDARAINLVDQLKKKIGEVALTEEEKVSAYEIAETIDEQFKSGKPKKV